MDHTAIHEVGYATTPDKLALQLAALTQRCGLDGVVCSAHEIKSIKQQCGSAFMTVTPGIRPQGSADDDQRRVATPAGALEAGADFLVIGRPITRAADCAVALNDIYAEISATYAPRA